MVRWHSQKDERFQAGRLLELKQMFKHAHRTQRWVWCRCKGFVLRKAKQRLLMHIQKRVGSLSPMCIGYVPAPRLEALPDKTLPKGTFQGFFFKPTCGQVLRNVGTQQKPWKSCWQLCTDNGHLWSKLQPCKGTALGRRQRGRPCCTFQTQNPRVSTKPHILPFHWAKTTSLYHQGDPSLGFLWLVFSWVLQRILHGLSCYSSRGSPSEGHSSQGGSSRPLQGVSSRVPRDSVGFCRGPRGWEVLSETNSRIRGVLSEVLGWEAPSETPGETPKPLRTAPIPVAP